MFVAAKIQCQLPKAWTAPAAAIAKGSNESVIYLVRSGKAVRASVQLGAGDGQTTQLRKLKLPGEEAWSDLTGSEAIATPANIVTEGQEIP